MPDRVHPLHHEMDFASLDDHGNLCVTAHAVAAANARQPDRMMEQKKFSDARRNSAWYEQIISHRRYCGVGMQDLKDGQCSVPVRTDPPLSVAVPLLCPVALGKCLVVCTAIMSLVVDCALPQSTVTSGSPRCSAAGQRVCCGYDASNASRMAGKCGVGVEC